MNFRGNKVNTLSFNEQPVYRAFFNGNSVFPELSEATTHPTSALTSNTAPSPYRVYYSSYYSNTYAAWKAFTNAVHTQGWASCSNNKNGTAWIALDLGNGNKIRDVKVILSNRNNTNVNGPNNIAIFGTNTAPTNGGTSSFTEIPSDAVILGSFTGLDGSAKSQEYVLDCVGNETTNCTREEYAQHINNAMKYGFRYIIIASTSWNQSGGAYLSIGCIKINGRLEN